MSDDEFVPVERVKGKRIKYGEVEYYVEWEGDYDDTWEKESSLKECSYYIDKFENSDDAKDDDSLPWTPMPKVIIGKEKESFIVEFDDGTSRTTTLTFGPMKELIKAYEKVISKKMRKSSIKKESSKSKTPKRKQNQDKNETETDENENGTDNKLDALPRNKSKIFKYEVSKISYIRQNDDGDFDYLVEFDGTNDMEFIPMKIMKTNFPQKVIEFYERCVQWEEEVPTE